MTEVSENGQLKAMATHAADQAAEILRVLYDEHSASFRWQMGSLLAINGAGLLSLKDLKFVAATYVLIAAICFFVGLGCALLIAFVGQKSNQKMLEPMTRMVLYWRSVALTGVLDESIQKEQDELIERATRMGLWPSRFGIASFILFAIGLLSIWIGWGFQPLKS